MDPGHGGLEETPVFTVSAGLTWLSVLWVLWVCVVLELVSDLVSSIIQLVRSVLVTGRRAT